MKKKISIAAVILILFDIAVTLCANYFICSAFDEYISRSNTLVSDLIAKAVTDKADKTEPGLENGYLNNKIHYYLNGYSMSVPYTAAHYGFYDDDNNLICETDDEMIVIESGESDFVYYCTVKNKDEIYDFLEPLFGKYSEVSPSVTSIARKDLECYITEMTVNYTADGEAGKEIYKSGGKIAPDFAAAVRSEKVKLFFMPGHRTEFTDYPDSIKKIYRNISERNDNRFAELTDGLTFQGGRSEGKNYNYFYFLGGDSTKELIHTVYGSNGKSYRLVSIYSFNIRELSIMYAAAFYLFTAAAAAVVIVIVEKVRTGKKKSDRKTE